MSKAKDRQDEFNENQAAAEEMPVESDQASAEREALINQLKEAEAKVVEYKDGWARSQAEFQNYRKRIERDSEVLFASM